MTFKKIIKQTMKNVLIFIIKINAAYSWPRYMLNFVYLRLNSAQRVLFHRYFARIFRDGNIKGQSGYWLVWFCGKQIKMPLDSAMFWLNWDTAVSIVGNDLEVKSTYQNLLQSSTHKPELFVDVGANYGTHSLLFLSQGIETITFEPNSSCHDYFFAVCRTNLVNPRLEHIALGEKKATVELSYPKYDTWNGSVVDGVKKGLSSNQALVTENVEQKKLDDYFDEIIDKKTLIKIDTEGNELSVLKGAIRLIEKSHPTIIFECWTDENIRTQLFEFFQKKHYSIYSLPYSPQSLPSILTLADFKSSSSVNFIAIFLLSTATAKSC
ncbi:MAG: FkbM family methyltransferase [Candidatus Electrothrix sp. AUS4]|nr:FkbM family methyltransferase [Candidatus Electrothrix sp. AUS4]